MREQGVGWDGNGLEVVLELFGTGRSGEEQLAFMAADPTNDANRQVHLAPQRTRLTFQQELELVGDETDAQGEASRTVDADAGTCSVDSGVVKVR